MTVNKIYAGCLPCATGNTFATVDAANQWIVRHWANCSQSKKFKPPVIGIDPEEKYAELKEAGQERPLCECHNEPMAWERRPDYTAGGRWKCKANRRYGTKS